jgi:hypothetical protein
MATLLCLDGYPLAYGIAFRAGAKDIPAVLVIAPFFTSFLIRTISWKIILGNDGAFLSIIRDVLGIVPPNFSIPGTPLAVITGLTYEFLPFMVLPSVRWKRSTASTSSPGPVRHRGSQEGHDRRPARWCAGGGFDGAFGCFRWAWSNCRASFVRDRRGRRRATATLLVSESFTKVIFPLSLSGVFAGSSSPHPATVRGNADPGQRRPR